MIKVEVVTQTTYVIELPVGEFNDICEPTMTIKQSDALIMAILEEKGIGVDKIIGAKERANKNA